MFLTRAQDKCLLVQPLACGALFFVEMELLSRISAADTIRLDFVNCCLVSCTIQDHYSITSDFVGLYANSRYSRSKYWKLRT